MVELWDVGILW